MNPKTSLIIPLLAVLAAFSFACSKPEKAHNMSGMPGMSMSSPDKAMKQTMTSMEAKAGDWLICPVRGEKFQVKATSLYAEIGGKKVYVCCAACLEPLKTNPKKYL